MSEELLKNYPPQPPATNWPSGLDTKKKEAFYRDLNREKYSCLPFVLCYIAALLVTWILMAKHSGLFYDRNLNWSENLFSFATSFVAALIPLLPLLAGYFVISRLILRIKLRKNMASPCGLYGAKTFCRFIKKFFAAVRNIKIRNCLNFGRTISILPHRKLFKNYCKKTLPCRKTLFIPVIRFLF